MRHREHGPKSLEIHIGGADIVVRGHGQFARLLKRGLDWLAGDGEQRLLSAGGASIDEVENRTLRLPENRRVRIGDEVAHAGGCLLYTSDAADEEDSVDLGGRRII